MHKEVNQKVSNEIYSKIAEGQQKVNEFLCAENCVARWLWRSGNLCPNGYAIPWEVQAVNTMPENFIWEEDRSTIMTVAPGVYEISLGLFSTKKPAI